MKTQTLNDAITFALGTDNCKRYLSEYENSPSEYEIYELNVRLIDPEKETIRLLINFRNIKNKNFYEDAIIDIQCSDFGNFKILKVRKANYEP